jgi:PucR C-terminal helix-turn-helix domain/GGDEF-like domain
MASEAPAAVLRRWGERFAKDALAARIVAGFRARADDIWRHAFTLLQRESPEYRNAVDAEFAEESKAHCNELLRTIVSIAARRTGRLGADPFEFVRVHARWRARHRVPLIASLHAYRLAHRTYWDFTREALPRDAKNKQAIRSLSMLSDFWIELFDHVGAVLADAHAVEERRIVAESTTSYAALIAELLCGREPQDAESVRLCALSGIRAGAPTAVLLARPATLAEDNPVEVEVTLRAFARFLEEALPRSAFGLLADVRGSEVVAVICGAAGGGGSGSAGAAREAMQALRRSGFTRRAGNGHGVRVGLSLDVDAIARLPAAHEEARLALEFAGAREPLMHFADIDLREFLVRRADKAAVRLVPEWAHTFSRAKDARLSELYRTIHAFADCNFNVKRTARRLSIHTNTVYFRLNRINTLTGINPRTYAGTAQMLTALRLLEIHDGGRGG